MVGDALDGIEVFGIFGELGESSELETERSDFSNKCCFWSLDGFASS